MILDPVYDLSALLVPYSWLRDAEFRGTIDIALVVDHAAVAESLRLLLIRPR